MQNEIKKPMKKHEERIRNEEIKEKLYKARNEER